MKDIQEALARVGEHLAEIAQVVVKAMDNLTPEQRAVIEFLAENPEVAEGLQELNQKLARQRAIRGTKNVQASKVPTFTACQSYRFEVLISNKFEECASKDLMKARLMDLLSEEIDKQLEAK